MVHEVSRCKAWKIDEPRTRSVNLQFLSSINTVVKTGCGKTKDSGRVSSQPVVSTSKRIQEISPIPNRRLVTLHHPSSAGADHGREFLSDHAHQWPSRAGRREILHRLQTIPRGFHILMALLSQLQVGASPLPTFSPLRTLPPPTRDFSILPHRGPHTAAFAEYGHGPVHHRFSTGSLYFALNFGDESGSPTQSWASVPASSKARNRFISALSRPGVGAFHSSNPLTPISSCTSPILFTVPILLLLISLILSVGLPNSYRQSPGRVPSLYTSLIRRKIVLWFLICSHPIILLLPLNREGLDFFVFFPTYVPLPNHLLISLLSRYPLGPLPHSPIKLSKTHTGSSLRNQPPSTTLRADPLVLHTHLYLPSSG
jgi:hypothetical protein